MALNKNRILWWIGIELLILIVFAIGVVVRYVLNYMYVNPTLLVFHDHVYLFVNKRDM